MELNKYKKTELINNISYSWVRADYRSLLPENYQELSIQKLI